MEIIDFYITFIIIPLSVVVYVCRYFDISAAKADLKYSPLISFKDGWKETIQWFKDNWLPTYQQAKKSARKKKAE